MILDGRRKGPIVASVFEKALSLLIGTEMQIPSFQMPKKGRRPLKNMTERELIQLESEIGREVFGPVPTGHRREFFNLDPTTWVWYEEYVDPNTKQTHSTTTRYEIQDKKILKAQEGSQYTYLEGDELRNLTLAVQMYYERVMRDLYKRDPHSGHKIV